MPQEKHLDHMAASKLVMEPARLSAVSFKDDKALLLPEISTIFHQSALWIVCLHIDWLFELRVMSLQRHLDYLITPEPVLGRARLGAVSFKADKAVLQPDASATFTVSQPGKTAMSDSSQWQQVRLTTVTKALGFTPPEMSSSSYQPSGFRCLC